MDPIAVPEILLLVIVVLKNPPTVQAIYIRGVLTQILPKLPLLSTVLSQYIPWTLAAELKPSRWLSPCYLCSVHWTCCKLTILSPDTRWMCRAVLLHLPVLLSASKFLSIKFFPFVLCLSLALSLSFPHFISGFYFYRLTN